MQPILIDEQTGILYRRWQTENTDACFLLVHGLGAHSGRWQALAEYFLSRNVSSYALELKGFGETTDLKGHVDSFNIYYQDINYLTAIIKEKNPGKKVFLIGESLGGLIVYSYVMKGTKKSTALFVSLPDFPVG